MASSATAYEAACEAVEGLLREPGRKAILPSELVSCAPAHACDRALRRYCEFGELTRVGQGIYNSSKYVPGPYSTQENMNREFLTWYLEPLVSRESAANLL